MALKNTTGSNGYGQLMESDVNKVVPWSIAVVVHLVQTEQGVLFLMWANDGHDRKLSISDLSPQAQQELLKILQSHDNRVTSLGTDSEGRNIWQY